jgi:hypothetical protein
MRTVCKNGVVGYYCAACGGTSFFIGVRGGLGNLVFIGDILR